MASPSSALHQAPNAADLFDVYFRRADLDRDGRISGAEAVAFFQGSGLPKPVLAQVWDYADHKRSGFLGQSEFFNALKLITVAQSKRELTPDIVKAAIYGPAAAKIPAPHISLATQTAVQSNTGGSVSMAQAGSLAPTALSSPGPRATQLSPSANVNQQQFPSQGSHGMRPPLPVSGTASRPLQGVGQGSQTGEFMTGMQPPNTNIPSSWIGGKASGGAPGAVSQVPSRGISASATQAGIGPMTLGSTTSLPPKPPTAPKMTPTTSQAKDSASSGVSRNGFSSNSAHGGDAFSAITSQPKQSSSSTNIPVFAGNQSFQPSPRMQSVGLQLPHAQSFAKQNQQVSNFSASTYTPPRVSSWAGDSASGQYQQPWPKMTQTDIQKYAKVFTAVDTDKDGKISGAQARNLFLSWRLPREILKQVWDLSDQDSDSMLSLKEFCIALYMMERYREGRPLPAIVPSSIISDFSTSGPPVTGHTTSSRGPKSDLSVQQTMQSSSSGQHSTVTAGMRLPDPAAAPDAEERPQINQQMSKVPFLEKHLLDQLSQEEQDSLNSKFKEATDSEKKVAELEKEIQDSREKIEFYRTKLQELILYKSRCDNRLNEIIERTSADKREAESLAKKYEEKYKQVGDVASRLTIEEATFRDIQEKKMELYRSIVKMDQGSNTDENLQDSVKQIQGELDELLMALNDRCKQYGLRGKPTFLLELPFGWQPGIQEGAADWDEAWDKFEDAGFTFVKELTLEVQNVVAPPKPKSLPFQKPASADEGTTADTTAASAETATKTVSTDENTAKSGKLTDVPHKVLENGSENDRSEKETVASETGSPVARSLQESPSKALDESETEKMVNSDTLTREKETHSDHEGLRSVSHKRIDDPAWGRFDTNDDIDSVWGFTPANGTKDNDHGKYGEDHFFGSEDFGLNPIRTQPSEAAGLSQNKNMSSFDESVPSTPLYNSASLSQKKITFSFDDSVPSTPLYSSANSPQKYREGSQPSFDSFSRFDSFNMQDSGPFAPQENLSRFDSFRSNNDYDYGHGFSSFDDSDPFGSGPFKTSIDSQTPRRFSDWDPSGSGPFRISLESQTPRSSYDSDPFGTGNFKTTVEGQSPRGSFDSDIFASEPFKTTRESQTPRSSDNWSAF